MYFFFQSISAMQLKHGVTTIRQMTLSVREIDSDDWHPQSEIWIQSEYFSRQMLRCSSFSFCWVLWGSNDKEGMLFLQKKVLQRYYWESFSEDLINNNLPAITSSQEFLTNKKLGSIFFPDNFLAALAFFSCLA